eukprot:jgi/Undpi1/5072/HiC_scaffold_19.g08424.m1
MYPLRVPEAGTRFGYPKRETGCGCSERVLGTRNERPFRVPQTGTLNGPPEGVPEESTRREYPERGPEAAERVPGKGTRSGGRILRESSRQEFEQARHETDPLVVARLLVVGRQCLNDTIRGVSLSPGTVLLQCAWDGLLIDRTTVEVDQSFAEVPCLMAF